MLAPTISERLDMSTQVKKPRSSPNHPSFKEMVTAAIKAQADKKGSSRHSIKRHIVTSYTVSETAVKANLNKTLSKLIGNGYLVHPKTGRGHYKLAIKTGDDGKAKKSKPVAAKKKATAVKKSDTAKKAASAVAKKVKPKKAAAKKPAAKKTVAKKAVAKKKPAAKKAAAAKKSPKKAAKKQVKKSAPAKKK